MKPPPAWLGLELSVTPPTQSTQVYFSTEPLAEALQAWRKSLKPFQQVVVVVDRNVRDCLDDAVVKALQSGFDSVVIYPLQGGEATKTCQTTLELYNFLIARNALHSTLLIALGGGVIGDTVGFVAATYLRGIPYAIIPTTLLSMVDSCLGGKTGVNLTLGKNYVGVTYQPCSILICPQLLSTLPERVFRSGLAEVIKYALLDGGWLLESLLNGPTSFENYQAYLPLITACLQVKAKIVQADPYESDLTGGRRLLNLGHTFAHAIEQVSGYQAYEHGEAVAVGLYLAACLSQHYGYLTGKAVEQVVYLLNQYKLSYQLVGPLSIDALLAAMRRDKKQQGGSHFTCIGLRRIGEGCVLNDVTMEVLRDLWRRVGAQ